VGAAKFIRGLVRRIDPERLTVVVNTGDDETFYGLHVSPDIDTLTYTLAGVVNRAQGWGLDDESFNVLRALERFYPKPWFALGDRDLATPTAPSGCAAGYRSAASQPKSPARSPSSPKSCP